MSNAPVAAKVEMTEAARVILKRLHPDRANMPMAEALDDIARAREVGARVRAELANARDLGPRVRDAVLEATVAGETNWSLVGAILLANARKEA